MFLKCIDDILYGAVSISVNVVFDVGKRVSLLADVVYSQPDVVAFDVALLKLVNPSILKQYNVTNPPIVSRAKQGMYLRV